MVKRIKKNKKTKKLGHRTFGRGNVKNRRGSGNRGGYGRAGIWKHKKTRLFKYEREFLEKKGFYREKKHYETYNLYDISNMIKNGEIKKDNDIYRIKLSGKLLGAGKLDYPVIIHVDKASKKAIQKVKEIGGEVIINDRGVS